MGGEFFGSREFLVGRTGYAGLAVYGQLKAVAVLGDGADGAAANDLSQGDDEVGEVGFAYVDRRPEGVDEFLFADEMLGAADEAEERVEGFGLEGEGSAGLFEEAVAGVEFEVGEPVGGVDGALIFL